MEQLVTRGDENTSDSRRVLRTFETGVLVAFNSRPVPAAAERELKRLRGTMPTTATAVRPKPSEPGR